MSNSLTWLIAGLILIGLELASGTFYLLVLGIAALAGSLTAKLGAPLLPQALVTAVIAIAGTLYLRRRRAQLATDQPPSQGLDVGQSVEAVATLPDGRLRVRYRGAEWTAERLPGDSGDGPLYIHAIRQNILLVAARRPD